MSPEQKTEPEASAVEGELSVISQGANVLAELSGRMGSHFRRTEVRKRVGRYLRGMLATVERKNGWQMAEELGEANAHGVQRLLEEADWDEEAVRDELRAYVIEHVGEADGILVVDETGFIKKGGERHVTTGCAAVYPGGHRTPRTSSAGQATGCWQYLRVAAESTGEQPRAACSLLPPAWGSVPAGRSALRTCLPGEGAPGRQFAR